MSSDYVRRFPTDTPILVTTPSDLTSFITTESDPLSWSKTGDQSSLSGTKSGSFGLSTSGTISASDITDTGLTASKPVFTDANKKLTSTSPLYAAFCTISYGSGNGGEHNYTLTTGFAQVDFSSLANYTLLDPGSHWDTTYNDYTCPVAGYYKITTKVRVSDDANSGSSYGIGGGTNEEFSTSRGEGGGDNAAFIWGETSTYRNGLLNNRIMHCSAGDHIMMYCYSDDVESSDGYMAIELLYID